MPRKTKKQTYNIALASAWRFTRVIIPQIPAYSVLLADQLRLIDSPAWVISTLMFIGAVATALDKYLRELNK